MKLSLNWLKEYIEIKESATELADLITLHIAEVEEVIDQAATLQYVVVGEVLSAKKHPNADNLNIGTFDVGEAEPRQIVFGGKAVLNPGDKLPIALPGAKIGEITITERKLRGEASRGMCCLNSELGILDNSQHVHLFSNDVKNGSPLSEVLGLTDTIIEIDNKTLTHRADLFNHIGFARELSVVLQRPLQIPELPTIESLAPASPALDFTVEISDETMCNRYVGLVFSNVAVAESPDWMQQRLAAVGIKAINNVVDITNYVMYEYGQPLHAFDYNAVSDHALRVRAAQPGESLTTLDDKTTDFASSFVTGVPVPVIADSVKPLALAGVMGGVDSEITDSTTTIAIESANFDPISIRKAAQALAKRTDGSTRHEKKLSLVFPELGMRRAAELLAELCGAVPASAVIDEGNQAVEAEPIDVSHEFIEQFIGITVSTQEVDRILTGLGFTVKYHEQIWSCVSPLWRTDITNQQDIVEEIARMHGYDAIPVTPLTGLLQPPTIEPNLRTGNLLIEQCVAMGATEVYRYSFYSEQDVKRLGLQTEDHISLLNPMNPDQQYLRQSLLPGLLQCVAKNQRNKFDQLSLVEYGHIYLNDIELPVIAGVIYGDTADVFYKAKGIVESLCSLNTVLATLQTINERDERSNENYHVFDMNADAIWMSNSSGKKEQIATIGIVRDDISKQYDIDSYVAYYTIHVPRFANIAGENAVFNDISLFPEIDLDISIEVSKNTPWGDIKSTIQECGKDLLQSVTVFDVYSGEGIEVGKKALGIHMILQQSDRTLEMKEAEAWRTTVIAALEQRHGAKHRY